MHVLLIFPILHKYRLYHAVEVYTGMYKTAETGLETRARKVVGIRYLCHADTLHAHVHGPWPRPRDSCTLCPAGSGVPDTTREQTTYARRLARDTYNSCPEATRQKACTNTGTYTRAMAPRGSCTLCPAGLDTTRAHHAQTTYARRFARDTYKTCPRGYDEESVYKQARPSEV